MMIKATTLGSLASATMLLSLAAASATADTADTKSVCLHTMQIKRTEIPDNNTMLFYMNDGSVWKNTLVDTCFGLKQSTQGFTWNISPNDEVCSNLQSIRVNDTHATCLLGAFTKVAGPKG